MELNQIIARLNELYHRSQQTDLTAEELRERDQLRRIYLDSIRGQVTASLTGVTRKKPTAHHCCGHSDDCDCSGHKH